MRILSRPALHSPLRLPGLLVGLLIAGGAIPAAAQVTTNSGALDSLGAHKPAARATSQHRPAPSHAERHASSRAPSKAAHAGSPHRAVAATIPAGPPPQPVFRAPIINVPLHPPPPPPPVPVVQTAIGAVTAIPGGTRITFGAGSADVNPTTMQALHAFSDQMKAEPLVRADLDAMSSGMPDDPSTPRRLALARGLAARAVLINDGIASTRIYVRVMDAAPKAADAGAPPDRVDLVLSPIAGSDAPPPAAGSSILPPVAGNGASPVAGSDAPVAAPPAAAPPVGRSE